MNDGSVLLTGTFRVITLTDGELAVSTNSILKKMKGGSPLNDGFFKLNITKSAPTFVTVRLAGSLGGTV